MKRWIALLLAGLTLLTLCACSAPFQNDYYYETPFSGDFGARTDANPRQWLFSLPKIAILYI